MSRKTEVICDFCEEPISVGQTTSIVKFPYRGKDVGVYIHPVKPHLLQKVARSVIPFEGVSSYDVCPDCHFKLMEAALEELIATKAEADAPLS